MMKSNADHRDDDDIRHDDDDDNYNDDDGDEHAFACAVDDAILQR